MPDPQAGESPVVPQLISQAFDQLLDDLYRHLVAAGYADLRPTHCLNVLRLIDCDGTRPSELARRAGMTPQAMGELVGYLEQRGYVRRMPDPVDRRGRTVVFADRGTAAAEVAAEFFVDVEAHWGAIVGPDRFRLLKEALAEIVRASPGDSSGSGGDIGVGHGVGNGVGNGAAGDGTAR